MNEWIAFILIIVGAVIVLFLFLSFGFLTLTALTEAIECHKELKEIKKSSKKGVDKD